VTGFQVYEFTIAGKWLQLLTEVAPSVRRIGLIHNPTTAPQGFLGALETLAPSSPVPLTNIAGRRTNDRLQALARRRSP